MGIYATTTSLETLLIGYTFDTATTDLATICITDGENEVRKYLSRRYDLTSTDLALTTTSSIPPQVTTWTEQWAEGLLYQRMSRGGKESLERGQMVLTRVRKNLDRVAEGESNLVAANGGIVDEKSNSNNRVLSNTDTYSPTFNVDRQENWRIDPDRLDDVATDRK